MDCQEGDQFLLEAYTCQASRQDKKQKKCYVPIPGLPWGSGGWWLQPAQHKAPLRDSPFTWLILPPCCPPSPLKTPLPFFHKVTVQSQRRSFWQTKSQNYPDTPSQERLTENTQAEDWSSDSIPQLLIVYSQAWVRMLSDALSNLILITACADVITPIFQMRKLIFWSLDNSPNVTQLLGDRVECEPRCSDFNLVFFLPHSNCFQATKTHSLLPFEIHKQPKSTLHPCSSSHSLWSRELERLARCPLIFSVDVIETEAELRPNLKSSCEENKSCQ